MKFTPNIRLRLLGDQEAGEKLIGVGKSLVPVLQNLSSFQNLKQNSFTKKLSDDVVMTVSHCFDQVSLDIWVRPERVIVPVVEEVAEVVYGPCDIMVLVTATQDGSPFEAILWNPSSNEILFEGTKTEYDTYIAEFSDGGTSAYKYTADINIDNAGIGHVYTASLDGHTLGFEQIESTGSSDNIYQDVGGYGVEAILQVDPYTITASTSEGSGGATSYYDGSKKWYGIGVDNILYDAGFGYQNDTCSVAVFFQHLTTGHVDNATPVQYFLSNICDYGIWFGDGGEAGSFNIGTRISTSSIVNRILSTANESINDSIITYCNTVGTTPYLLGRLRINFDLVEIRETEKFTIAGTYNGTYTF